MVYTLCFDMITNNNGDLPNDIIQVVGNTVNSAVMGWGVRNGVVTQIYPTATDVFTLTDAAILFSVSMDGTITLSISSGTFQSINFFNGQNIGVNNGIIELNGFVRVPDTADWSNRNELIAITGFTRTQASTLTSSVPNVRTEAATQILNTSIRFNGLVVSDGNETVISRGFYWLAGNQTVSNTITNGARIDATAGNNDGFSAVQSGLTTNSEYTFVAWAVNSEGEGTAGNKVTTTTGQTVVTTTVDWVPVPAGTTDCSGGTAGTSTFGTYGSWSGATNIVLSDRGVAISAECAVGQATCSVSRNRSSSTPFTDGTRSVQYQCTIIVQGTTSTPNCTTPTGDGTTSNVGSLDNRIEDCDYTATGTDTQTLDVTNTADTGGPGTIFTEAEIQVVSCSVTADGQATVVTNFGTAVAVDVQPNLTSGVVPVNIQFSVSGTIPAGFEEAGVGTFSFTSGELSASPASCNQDAGATPVQATAVSWDAASISFTNGTGGSQTVGANANGTWTIVGGGNAIFISPSSGNGDTDITFFYNGINQTRNGRAELGGTPQATAEIEIDYGF